jgi:hypothetical protein
MYSFPRKGQKPQVGQSTALPGPPLTPNVMLSRPHIANPFRQPASSTGEKITGKSRQVSTLQPSENYHVTSLITKKQKQKTKKQKKQKKLILPPTPRMVAHMKFRHGGLRRGGEAKVGWSHRNSPTTFRGAAIPPKSRPRPQMQ